MKRRYDDRFYPLESFQPSSLLASSPMGGSKSMTPTLGWEYDQRDEMVTLQDSQLDTLSYTAANYCDPLYSTLGNFVHGSQNQFVPQSQGAPHNIFDNINVYEYLNDFEELERLPAPFPDLYGESNNENYIEESLIETKRRETITKDRKEQEAIYGSVDNDQDKNVANSHEDGNTSSKVVLSREVLTKYFYMPITQAAKELNVGLTLLKRRCRELGIGRWPHRKLMSLQTLIENVQQMKSQGGGGDMKVDEVIELLENEKRLMEEMPNIELGDMTKKLRQACFKANYKKRKTISLMSSNLIPNQAQLSQHEYNHYHI